MGSKALVENTSYEITGGKTLTGNTSYSISQGSCLIKNSQQKVELKPELITFCLMWFWRPDYEMQCPKGYTWNDLIGSKYDSRPLKFGGGQFYLYNCNNKTVEFGRRNILFSPTKTDPDCVFTEPQEILLTDKIIDQQLYRLNYMCCFFPRTKITLDFNGTTKNIEDIQEGDYVLSYNVNLNKNYISCVHKKIIHRHTTDKAILTCENGTILNMRPYHPLYTNEGWKSLTEYKNFPLLKIRDELKTINGYTKLINVSYETVSPIDTYTLSVVDLDEIYDNDENDNYYANGICAHNKAC